MYLLYDILQMFGSFTGMLSTLRQKRYIEKMSNNFSQNYQKIKQQILSTKLRFIEIANNIFYMDYPQLQTAQQLKNHIGNSSFQIWNLSQYKYDSHLQLNILGNNQDGQIHNLCYQYYTNIPFYELILAMTTINKFLALNKNNKVYIHCQDNKIRSGIFLSCYIYQYRINEISDISQAILFINQQLQIKIQDHNNVNQQFSFRNQHLIFKNFINYHNNSNIINQHQLRLLKIIINNIPPLRIGPLSTIDHSINMKVALEIRCGQTILLKKLYPSNIFEGNCMCLKLENANLLVSDEFLIMVKYLYKGDIYNLFRLQLNSNFIFHSFMRIYEHDIDLSLNCKHNNDCLMHLDLIFDNRKELSNLALLKDLATFGRLEGLPSHSAHDNMINNKCERKFSGQMISLKGTQGQLYEQNNINPISQDITKDQRFINENMQLSDELFDIMNENQLEIQDELNQKIIKAIKSINCESELQEKEFGQYLTLLEQQS